MTLFATMNWMHMFTHAQKAMIAPNLAPDHEGGGAGTSDHSVEAITPDPDHAPDEQHAITVDDSGRSVDAVIAALASGPIDIERFIEGKSDAELTRPAQDGGWGMVEILPHLRDWEEIIGSRVSLILAEDSPSLEEHDDSLWTIEHGYRDQDPRVAFKEFAELRAALVERLGRLAPGDWNRNGVLPKRGRVTLHWLMNNVCNHDAKHVVQAKDVLA
jgi:hypothetical protein